MAKHLAKRLRIYAEQRAETLRPTVETIAWLPELQQAFQQATGWSLRYTALPGPRAAADGTGLVPTHVCKGTSPGHFEFELNEHEPLSSMRSGEASKQIRPRNVKNRAFRTEGDLKPDDLEPAAPRRHAPKVAAKSAALLASTLAEMLNALLETRHALWQREAELAAGVPLLPHREEEKHLADRLEAVLRGGAEAVGCQAAALYLLDDATTVLKLRCCCGLPFDRLTAPSRPLQGATADLEALLGHAVVLEDTTIMRHWRVPENFPAAVCVPVSTPTSLLGTLWVFADEQRGFDDHQTNLLEIVAGRLAADLEREMLLHEGLEAAQWKQQLAAAERLQRSQLPSVAPLLDGWEVAGWTEQSQPVGGDFHDWFCLPNGLLALTAGHAMEQGIEAALAANALKALVRAHGQYHREAQHTLKQINRSLWTGSAGDQHASLFFGLLETATGRLCSAAAGASSAMLLRSDGWQLLNQASPRLGVSPESDYEQFGYQLEPGEALLIFTGGVFDTTGLQEHPRTTPPWLEPLLDQLHRSAEQLASMVRERLLAHTTGSAQRRDQTVLSVTAPTWRVLPAWMSTEGVVSVPPLLTDAAEPVAVPAASRQPGPAAAEGLAGRGFRRQADSVFPSASPTGDPMTTDSPATPQAVPAAESVYVSGPAAVVLVWLAGMAAVLTRTLLGVASLALLGWRARLSDKPVWRDALGRVSQDLGLRRQVTLLESRHRAMPMVWGIWRPKLLVPAESGEWSIQRRRVVLLHELAHVKRWDCLWQMVVQMACAVYWFHPLVWAVRRWMQAERERACDDMVLHAGAKPSDYARHLLEIASGLYAGRLSDVVAIAMARPSRLEGRLLAILDAKRSRRALTWSVVLAGIVLVGGVLVPVSMMKAGAGSTAETKADVSPSTQPAVDELPQLRFLAWQEPERRSADVQPPKAWHADGQPATDDNDLRLLRNVQATGMQGYPEDIAFLCLWFSHRQIDETAFREVRLLDQGGQPILSAHGSFASVVQPCDASTDHLGWISYVLSSGLAGRTPAVVDVELKYGVGEWRAAGETIPPDFHGLMCLEYGATLSSIGQDSRGKAFIAVVRDREGQTKGQMAFRAATTDGRSLVSAAKSKVSHGDIFVEQFVFDVPLSQVQSFRELTRPLQTVIYKNVSLVPGKTTDMQVVEVGRSATQPAGGPAASSADAKPARDRHQSGRSTDDYLQELKHGRSTSTTKIIPVPTAGGQGGGRVREGWEFSRAMSKEFGSGSQPDIGTPWEASADSAAAAASMVSSPASAPASQPACLLDFRIAPQVQDLSRNERDRYMKQLAAKGPSAEPGDVYAWFECGVKESSLLILSVWQGKTYVLLHNQSPRVMLMDTPGGPAWGVDSVRVTPAERGDIKIDFQLDEAGGTLMKALTTPNQQRVMAILLNGRAIWMPQVRTPLGSHLQITLGREMDRDEADWIVAGLKACIDRPGAAGRPATTRPGASADQTRRRYGSSPENHEDMPEGTGAIAGRVVDDKTGEPVSGALLTLFYTPTFGSERRWTSEDGAFRFDSLPGGDYSLSMVRADGYQVAQYSPQGKPQRASFFPLHEGQKLVDVVLRLKPAHRVSGYVLDERGKPLGALRSNSSTDAGPAHSSFDTALTVVAWAEVADPAAAGSRYEISGQTPVDNDGHYELNALDDRPVYIMVQDFHAADKDNPYPPRYAPGTFFREDARLIRFDEHDAISGVDIRLSRTGGLVLEGVVSDAETGRPIPKALVTAQHADMLFDHVVGYTDDQGHYRLEALDAGQLRVHVDATPSGSARYRKMISLAAGEGPAALDFQLTRGVEIRGRFVDAAGHEIAVDVAHGEGHATAEGMSHAKCGYSGMTNRYRPAYSLPFGMFFSDGQGPYDNAGMQFPSATTFVFLGAPAGELKLTFNPRQPGLNTLKILHGGTDITGTRFAAEPGQVIDDVVIVLGRSPAAQSQPATQEAAQFSTLVHR